MSKRRPEQTLVTYYQTAPLIAVDLLHSVGGAILKVRHAAEDGTTIATTADKPVRHRKARTPRAPRHEPPPLVERPQ